jgi:nitrite reductase (NAD(P)H)
MKPEHHQNQDTNDRYMANVQRDGTFSVVPRIAAGEITPEGLIAIGNVAKKYKLYTKACASVISFPMANSTTLDYGRAEN